MRPIGYIKTDRNHAEATMTDVLVAAGVEPRAIFVEGRGLEDLAYAIHAVREGGHLVVPALWMLAPDDRREDRKRAMIAQVCEVEQRGGYVLEALTGRDSRKRRDAVAMALDAVEYLANRAKGRSSAANGRRSAGRPPAPISDDEWDRAERLWFSRQHDTTRDALVAMQQINPLITEWRARHKFGPRNPKK